MKVSPHSFVKCYFICRRNYLGLFEIISVRFEATYQLLIMYFVDVKHLAKNCESSGKCISQRKMSHLQMKKGVSCGTSDYFFTNCK
jgi:hypothetical protein